MRLAPLLACLAIALPAPAAVVINEIFYHAPNDLADLQWVELHNTGGDPVDLSDWLMQRGLLFRFPKGTTIEPHGFLVVARNPERFAEHYPKAPKPLGPVVRPMSKAAATIELLDAKGQRVDAAHYDDHGLWPASPDGYSSSLERICPTAPGDASENWAAPPCPKTNPVPEARPADKTAPFPPPSRRSSNPSAPRPKTPRPAKPCASRPTSPPKTDSSRSRSSTASSPTAGSATSSRSR